MIYKRKCKYCGKEFYTNMSHKQTCSKECGKEFSRNNTKLKRIKPKSKYTKICEYCGKEYTTTHKNQKYCSKRCSSERYRNNNKIEHKNICVICGKEFTGRSCKCKYCSPDCAKEGTRKIAEKKRLAKRNDRLKNTPSKTCPICGKEFVPRSKIIKCCSKECQEQYHTNRRHEYNEANKERRSNYNKRYKQEHKEEISAYNKEYRQREGKKERANQRKAEFRQENLELVRERDRRRGNKKYAEDIVYRMKVFARGQIYRCIINKAGKHTFNILGYTAKELKAYIETLWEPWMNWSNYGHGEGKWSIDHIKPISAFNFLNEDQSVNWDVVKEANALSNLRPLDSSENSFVKNDTWTPQDEEDYQKRKLQNKALDK